MGFSASSRGLRIGVGSLLLVVPLLFFTDLTRNPYYTQITLFNVLLSLLWLGWLVQGVRAGRWCWRSTAVDLPLTVLLVVAFLSWGWSWWRHPAMRTPITHEGARNTLFLFMNWALVYWFVVQSLPEGWVRWSWRLIGWGALLAASYGVIQSFGIELIWPRGMSPYSGRPISTFGNSTLLGSYLAMVLPWVFARWLVVPTGWKRWGVGCMMGGCFAGLLITFTRSAWVGAMVGLGWVGWNWWRWVKPSRPWRRLCWMAVLAVLTAWCWPRPVVSGYRPTVLERLQEVTQAAHHPYGAWHQRLLIWRCAWQMIQEHPILGQGWGCFELFYPFYQGRYLEEPLFQGFRTHANNVHNVFFEWWAQTGTIGLGVWCWLLGTVLMAGWRIAQRLSGATQVIAQGWLGGILAMCLDNLLNVSFFFTVPALLFWWMVGSLFAVNPDCAPVRCWTHASWPVTAMAGALILCFAWWGVRSVKDWVAEIQYFQGFQLAREGRSAAATAALELSHRLRRFDVNTNYELGNGYARQGRLDEAIWAYGAALGANAGYDEVYTNLGAALARRGRLTEALQRYQQAFLINPLSSTAKQAIALLAAGHHAP